MYVKIEKDISNNYLLVEAKQVDIRGISCMMALTDYINGLVVPLCEDVGLKEQQCLSEEAKQVLKDITPPHFIWQNIKPVTDIMCVGDIEYNCNCAVKGVIADGICYVTFGSIYILNDKGQTIQRI
jgi:hypothetical protein